MNYHKFSLPHERASKKKLRIIYWFRRKCEKTSFPIDREVKRLDKNRAETTKTLSHGLKFIESASYVASTLLNLVNGPAGGIHKTKCKYRHDHKKCETCGVKSTIASAALNAQAL